jgi:hypothetical protein
MSRPRISDYRRRMQRGFPLARVGIPFNQTERRTIEAMVAAGDSLGAQRAILAKLSRAFDGPRTVARQRGGRKVLRAAEG